MAWAYGRGIIGKTNKKLFQAWSKQDPVDQWECERAKIIRRIQGNENPVLKKACQKAGLWSRSIFAVSPIIHHRGNFESTSTKKFQCGSKKYCKEMTTCKEAMFYLNKCGLNGLDRDNDGVPCESLCR